MTTLPGARFDPVTGVELAGRDDGRRRSYALQQGEPVMSFNLVSSLLPLASGAAPQTYRWALALGLLVPVVAGALGYLAFAFVAAALLIPVVYTIYLYDVNQWDDQPLGVTLGTLGVAGALGVGFTWLWHGLLDNGAAVAATAGAGFDGIDWTGLLVLCLLVPVVSEVLKQAGPVFLACRPQFDDLIDALTFGVAAGSAFAAAETIVLNRALFSSFGQIDDVNSGFWVSLVLSAALVKPIVYGAATGIALAAFSGVGRGYSGFRSPYVRGLAEAIAANIVFQVAMYVASLVGGTTGAWLGLVLGVAIAVVLLLRLRYLLHVAVLEAALESAGGGDLKDTVHGTAWCPSCDLPLVEGANFCVACGTAVRAASKVSRRRNAAADDDTTTPPATEPPHDNQRTALVVGAALAVVLVGGLVAQLSAAASSEVAEPSDPGITLEPDLDGGSPIDPEPTPAPPPGPTVAPSASPSAAGSPRAFVLAADTTGVNLELAPGWVVLSSTDTQLVAGRKGGSAIFTVDYTAPPADAAAMVQAHLSGLMNDGVQNLEVTQPRQVALPNADYVAAQQLNMRGILATQQGGSFPVEGFAIYLVRRDGVGITAAGLYGQGTLASTPEVVDEYASMLDSIVR